MASAYTWKSSVEPGSAVAAMVMAEPSRCTTTPSEAEMSPTAALGMERKANGRIWRPSRCMPSPARSFTRATTCTPTMPLALFSLSTGTFGPLSV
ncbi:MAG: hypothetical protein ACLTNT_04640 [Bifidobacterium animalis]